MSYSNARIVPRTLNYLALLLLGSFGPSAQGWVEPGIEVLSTLSAPVPGGQFGWEIRGIPDVNGDGLSDLLIPEPFLGAGTVSVYSGADGSLIHTIPAPAGGQFGHGVNPVGDLDDDGVGDFIVGAIFGTGRAFVFSGASGDLLLSLQGENNGDRFGAAVTGAGDITGDGVPDLLVGADTYSIGGNQRGRAYWFSGADGSLIRTFDGLIQGQRLGAGTGLLGDINGDGVDDHVVGATGLSPQGDPRAYVLSGSDGSVLFQLTGDAGAVGFQYFVSGPGDVNADGTPDIYVGDFSHASGSGRAYVFSGLDGSRLLTIPGSPGQGVGTGRGAGDVDGDGHTDLIIGHWTSSDGAVGAGKAVLYSGLDGSVLMSMTSTRANENFGFDTSSVGDVNGDGRDDFMISAASADRVYLIAGTVDKQISQSVDSSFSGAWYDPSHDGEGFLIEVLSDGRALVYWFTYDENRKQRWFLGVGEVTGDQIVIENLLVTQGGMFGPSFDPDDVVATVVGSLTINFSNCDSGIAAYVVNGVSGELVVVRLTRVETLLCEPVNSD